MAAKYLKSLVTGVVLPYSEPALKSADLRLMEPAECEEYEASMGVSRVAAKTASKPEPEPEPEFTPEFVPEPEPEFEEVVIESPVVSDSVPESSEEDKKVMAALEVD